MKQSIIVLSMSLLLSGAHAASAEETFQQADARLNKEYRQIKERLQDSPATAKYFIESQRKWVAYRDAECAFQASIAEGGSVYSSIVQACMQSLTTARLGDFERYLSCEEGDLSCPVPRKE